jgi:hypothetical protein
MNPQPNSCGVHAAITRLENTPNFFFLIRKTNLQYHTILLTCQSFCAQNVAKNLELTTKFLALVTLSVTWKKRLNAVVNQ